MTMLGAQLTTSPDSQPGSPRHPETSALRDNAVTTTSTAVESISSASEQALASITSHMEHLEASVAAAVSQAESTQWIGANADRFRTAAQEFHSSMTAGQQATTDAFASFQASVAAMNDTLSTYVQQLSGALTAAQEAAAQMAAAVDGQRANLDQVMNAGLTVG
ncbi:MAG: hypothetical protein R2706_10460 [Acidimicrobiales bacterium]